MWLSARFGAQTSNTYRYSRASTIRRELDVERLESADGGSRHVAKRVRCIQRRAQYVLHQVT